MITKSWKRYRFYTKSVQDERPLIFDARYPWWCSGYSIGNDIITINQASKQNPFKRSNDYVVIIAYLPSEEDLFKYWDDAYNIDFTEETEIQFSDRFPKPDYFIES
jgi:hypothetical protein